MANKTKISYLPKKINILLFIIIFILLLVQSLFLYTVSKRVDFADTSKITNLIIQSVDALNRDLPIDARTGIAYIEEAGLTLPPTPDNVGYVTYSYQRANEDFKPILHISRKNDISAAKSAMTSRNTMEEAFDQVPRLQACSRGVSISYDVKDVQRAAGSKQLVNGKTIYFSTEPLCDNGELLTYAKQIESYK